MAPESSSAAFSSSAPAPAAGNWVVPASGGALAGNAAHLRPSQRRGHTVLSPPTCTQMGQMGCRRRCRFRAAQAELPRGRSLPGVRRSQRWLRRNYAGRELVVRALNPRGARRQPPTWQRAQIEPTAAFPRAPLAGLGSGSGRWEWCLPAAAVAAHSLHYTGAKSRPGGAPRIHRGLRSVESGPPS